MWDHHINKHPDDQIDPESDYSWRLLDRMKDPMTRQIREAVSIEDALPKGIHHTHLGQRRIVSLNRKEEHFQARRGQKIISSKIDLRFDLWQVIFIRYDSIIVLMFSLYSCHLY